LAVEDIRIPDIGDAEDVEVVELCVAVGDEVAKDDALIVIESDKASMEVPSPLAGKIKRIDVALGDKVKEGQLIAGVEVSASPTGPKPAGEKAGQKKRVAEDESPAEGVEGNAPAGPSDGLPAGSAREAKAESRSRAPAPKQAPAHEPRADKARVEVRLPEVGDAEGITVVEVAVKAGDSVAVDDLLLVVESDKASMEVPAPVAGTVLDVAVAEGTEVAEGSLLVTIETAETARPEKPATASDPESEKRAPAAADSEARAEEPSVRGTVAEDSTGPSAASASGAKVYAGPAVRRMARELGVDLARVKGSGARGRIVKDDVQQFVKKVLTDGGSATGGIPQLPAVDFAKFGPVETVPLSRIRRRGAENLHRSWLNVVHVTQHDEADVTELEAFRARIKSDAAARGVKVTPLPFIVAAVARTLKEFPQFNASLDSSVQNLILKRYINLGFAVDTPDGLVVPVIKAAETKGIFELAEDIERLSEKARNGKLAPGDMSGGSFSISSLGPIGGTAFTPIVNAPEVAILGVSRLATKPHWNGESFEPRQFLPLSLSYDHRAINGAEAGRFVTALCAVLADIRRVLL
jgi:pyruvate dehydrogenase E2 component (dihydrolipoamide acetyltransferase)